MKKLILFLLVFGLLDCTNEINPEQKLVGYKWVLASVTPATHQFYTNERPYLVFKPDGQFDSNFLTNCYDYRIRNKGEILTKNNCVDCTCPPNGCANGLACNEQIWPYRFVDQKLEIDFRNYKALFEPQGR